MFRTAKAFILEIRVSFPWVQNGQNSGCIGVLFMYVPVTARLCMQVCALERTMVLQERVTSASSFYSTSSSGINMSLKQYITIE